MTRVITFWEGWAKKRPHHLDEHGVHDPCNEELLHLLPLKSRIQLPGTSPIVGWLCFRKQSTLLVCGPRWGVWYKQPTSKETNNTGVTTVKYVLLRTICLTLCWPMLPSV